MTNGPVNPNPVWLDVPGPPAFKTVTQLAVFFISHFCACVRYRTQGAAIHHRWCVHLHKKRNRRCQ